LYLANHSASARLPKKSLEDTAVTEDVSRLGVIY
jgi:hypothetical protein